MTDDSVIGEAVKREVLARALYAEYRERSPGTLTWENDWKADEFKAQADRILAHLPRTIDTLRPQSEPSDAQVLAALNAYNERNPGRTISDWSDESVANMRAALRAAGSVEQEEGD